MTETDHPPLSQVLTRPYQSRFIFLSRPFQIFEFLVPNLSTSQSGFYVYLGNTKFFGIFNPPVGLIKIPIPEMSNLMTVKGIDVTLPQSRVLRQESLRLKVAGSSGLHSHLKSYCIDIRVILYIVQEA